MGKRLRSRRRSRDRSTPILDPRTHTIRVEKLGIMGEGIAHLEDGGVIFVPFVNVGELCEVREVARRKHFIEAVKTRTIETGVDAAVPRCPLFGACGGCQLQHIEYAAQVEQKRQVLAHTVAKYVEGAAVEVTALPSERVYEYRRRVRMRQSAGRVGYFRRHTLKFLPVPRCEIAMPQINAWLQDPANFPRPETRHDISLDVCDDGVLRSYEGVAQVNMGFHQVNPAGEQALQKLIASELAEGFGGVLELYAGAGALILPWLTLGDAQRYLGVDGDGVNTCRGAEKFGAPHIRFEKGNLPAWLIKQSIREPHFFDGIDVIVADPPRSGMGDDMRFVKNLDRVPTIIYVSCDPSSWARDVKTLSRHFGYRLSRVVMVDMFPQTRHFEIFSVLRTS